MATSLWTPQSSPDNDWTSVTYGNNLFVAVASSETGNRVMTSPDGLTWTSQTSAADNDWTSVTYGNNLFVAVASSGTGNRVMTSSDGIEWTSQTSAADNDWTSVTYRNNLFVAVASSGSERVMISQDGIFWITMSAPEDDWTSVTYGNGLFVAVSQTGTYRVMTSNSGTDWSSWSVFSNDWRSVTYGNNLFVAVASSGTGNRVMISQDGANWSIPPALDAPDNDWTSVTYGNNLFVAVASSGAGNSVMTSPDGINWTSQSDVPNNLWQSVTYGNNLFVAVSESGTNRVMTATTVEPNIGTFTIPSKTYGNAPFIITAPTSNSTGSFSYTSSNTSVATISGNTITIVGAGSSIITATQAATTNYTSGSTTATFTVNQATPTLSNFSIPSKTYGNAPFIITAPTSNSTGKFSYTSSNTSVATISGGGGASYTITIVGAGSSIITATQAATTNYTSGSTTATFTVNPAIPTIEPLIIPSKTYGDAPFTITDPTSDSDGSFSYTSSNTSVATISGNTITIVGGGTSIITATQAATSNYTLGTTTTTFTVNPATTILSNFSILTKGYGAEPFPITAPTSNRAGSFSYTSSNTSVATVSGNIITIVGVGNSIITAIQAATNNYTLGIINTNFRVYAPPCFNENTEILCLNSNLKEEYIPIQKLKKGDLVKTYKHGYKKIKMIGKNTMRNNPLDPRCCMFKMKKNDTNGLTKDLIVTGYHSILVDKITANQEKNVKILGSFQSIEDKYLLVSSLSKDFVKLDCTDIVTYYHLVLENGENKEIKFGIWSNGILTESTCEKHFLEKNFILL
jgi:hypothetical protein